MRIKVRLVAGRLHMAPSCVCEKIIVLMGFSEVNHYSSSTKIERKLNERNVVIFTKLDNGVYGVS